MQNAQSLQSKRQLKIQNNQHRDYSGYHIDLTRLSHTSIMCV